MFPGNRGAAFRLPHRDSSRRPAGDAVQDVEMSLDAADTSVRATFSGNPYFRPKTRLEAATTLLATRPYFSISSSGVPDSAYVS